MLIGRGAINGKRILSPQTVECDDARRSRGVGYMGIWGLGLNLALPEGVTMPNAGSFRIADAHPNNCRNAMGSHAVD